MNGWFSVTRGTEVDQVDGTKKRLGKIAKGWYFFWFKKKETPKRIQYKGQYLLEILKNVKALCPEAPITFAKDYLFVEKPMLDMIPVLEQNLKVKISASEQCPFCEDGIYVMQFYKEEDDYVHAEWLRTVLAGCLPCFSSVYGTIIFLVFHSLALGSGTIGYMYSWSPYPVRAMIATWIMCMCIWTWLNMVFYKLANISS